jgi:LDH2 family malate/lactate/ureidoglycolate dehydrogenase
MTARFQAAALQAYAVEIMRANGVDALQAECAANNLVWSELVGRSNFGLQRLPIHIERVRRGVISCPCPAVFEPRSDSIALLDGGGGFGHYVGELGMRRAIALAHPHGVGVVGVRNSNFLGAAAYFVQLAAEAQMIGLAMSNSFPKVAAHGGVAPVLGTNPFAFGAPRRNGESLLIDMATSALAGSTVREHIEKQEPLPEGLAIDAHGAPITDPRKVDEGALLPFAGAKGFALSLMVELLAGIITGAGVSNGVASMYKDFSRSGDNGHFFLALDISCFMDIETYYKRFEGLIAILKDSGDEVLLPGEIRWRTHAANLKRGIAVDRSTLVALAKLAQPFGIAPPEQTELSSAA